MSGAGGGWIVFLPLNSLMIGIVSILLSFVVRLFTRGVMMVVASVLLGVASCLLLAAAGMAKLDFTVWFMLPYVLCAGMVGGIWLLALKGQVLRG